MSRGPGRIERSIQHLLDSNPTDAFTTNEIITACFPGESAIEKKHRVSALRALRKVAYAAGWCSEMIGGQRGEFIIYNPLNLHSYAVGRTRAHENGDWNKQNRRSQVISSAKAEAMLLGRDEGTHWHHARDKSYWIRTDGPYPVAVARHHAIMDGDTDRAEALWREFQDLIRTAVFLPERIVGEIHPDFLRDVAVRSAA